MKRGRSFSFDKILNGNKSVVVALVVWCNFCGDGTVLHWVDDGKKYTYCIVYREWWHLSLMQLVVNSSNIKWIQKVEIHTIVISFIFFTLQSADSPKHRTLALSRKKEGRTTIVQVEEQTRSIKTCIKLLFSYKKLVIYFSALFVSQ